MAPCPGGATWTRPRAARVLLPCLFLACWAPPLHGDGFVFKRGGQYVREEEQRAFIEWQEGRQTLFLATRVAANTDPTVWIVPIPAPPDQTDAEPVTFFRHVASTKSVVAPARKTLTDTWQMTLCLDSGLPGLMPLFLGTNVQQTFSKVGSTLDGSGVEVHKHVEKHGMVVEVLTARTTEALDRYLASKDMQTRAANLHTLQPYLEQQNTLVCGWRAGGDQPTTARALEIHFPTPVIFYPLQPTRVYQHDIATSIFVRGWAQPVAGTTLPGLRCRYLEGRVMDEQRAFYGYPVAGPQPGPNEPLTQVELHPSPQGWTEDLRLVPGPPPAVALAAGLRRGGLGVTWLATTALGAVLALFLPWAILPRDQRSAADWGRAALLGASVGLSLLASALLFRAWYRARRPGPEHPTLGLLPLIGWPTAALALLCLALALREPSPHVARKAVRGLAGALVLGPLVIAPVAVVGRRVFAAAGKDSYWLITFVALHGGVVLVLCVGLNAWLSRYA